MNVQISEKESSKVAIIESADILISNTQDALELMATIRQLYGCDKMVIREKWLRLYKYENGVPSNKMKLHFLN